MRKSVLRSVAEIVQLEARQLLSAVSAANISVPENGGSAVFTISIDSAQSTATAINFSTKNGTGKTPAKAAKDYTAAKGTATIAAGATSTTVTVPIIDNTTFNGNRTFQLSLTKAPKGVTL